MVEMASALSTAVSTTLGSKKDSEKYRSLVQRKSSVVASQKIIYSRMSIKLSI